MLVFFVIVCGVVWLLVVDLVFPVLQWWSHRWFFPNQIKKGRCLMKRNRHVVNDNRLKTLSSEDWRCVYEDC